jgi:hypothetical protein
MRRRFPAGQWACLQEALILEVKRNFPRRRDIVLSLAAAAIFASVQLPVFAQCSPCVKPSFGPAAEFQPAVGTTFFDFDGDGHLDALTIAGTSIKIARGTGTGHFGPPVVAFEAQLQFYDPITSAAVADFNGDGIPDLALAHEGSGSDGGLMVVLGKGGGTFGSSIAIPGGHPRQVQTADFDGDGKIDIVALAPRDNGATVRFGNGDGTFGASVFLAVQGVVSMASGDFDGDGKPDLSLGQPNYPFSGGVFVFLHQSARAFAAPVLVPADSYSVPQTAVDLDGDGRTDLFVEGVVYLSRGGGTFETPLGIGSAYPAGIVADFNGDGFLDLASEGDNGIDLYLGDGSGTFGGPLRRSFGVPFTPQAAADLNEDGLPDLIGDFLVALARPDGTFGIAPAIRMSFQVSDFQRADFTGDGIPDVVVSAGYLGGIQLLAGQPGGTFAPPVSVSTTPAYSLAVGDFNNDGRADLATATDTGIEIRLGVAGGGLSAPAPLAVGHPASLSVGDLRGIGRADIVFLQNGQINVLLSNGDGTFASAIKSAASASDSGLLVSDLNGDGKPDLVVYGGASVSTYLGDGAGRFAFRTGKAAVSPVHVADVNGDSRPDVIAGMSGAFQVYLNDGSGGLLAPITFTRDSNGFSTYAIAAADFNGDGRMDLAFQAGWRVRIELGDGTGRFTESSSYSIGDPPVNFSRMLAVDLDGDGKADLIGLSEPYQSLLWVLRNTGCEARRLGIERDASSCGPAGVPFSSQPIVRVYDDSDNPVVCPGSSVSASLLAGGGNPAASLTGTTAVPVSDGAGRFTDLGISLPGAGYRIGFTHSAGAVASRFHSRRPSSWSRPRARPGRCCWRRPTWRRATGGPWTGPSSGRFARFLSRGSHRGRTRSS